MDNKTDCTNRAAVVADELLSIGAVFLSPDKPFTWASGIKSPIYCDNRLTLTAPDVRNNIENSLAEIIQHRLIPRQRFSWEQARPELHTLQQRGIFWDCPWATFRRSAKDHGGVNN